MTGFSFGATPAKTSTTGFSFGSAATTKPATTGFSFGNTSTTTTPASTGFSFGNTTKPSTGFSFGNTSTTNKSSGFSFGGFGSTTTNNQSDAQKKEQERLKNLLKPEDHKDQLAMALTCPQLFGDERDQIIAKWNQLQAAWGTGRAFRHNQMEPIKLSARNTFCRFKAMGYSRMPESRDKDGLVWLQIDKPEELVRQHQSDFVGALQGLLGNNLNIAVKVDAVKPLPDNKCEMAVYIQETLNMTTGAAPSSSDTYRVPTHVLYGNLMQMEDKLKNMGVTEIVNRVAMTEDQIQMYLETPPPGISEIQWNEAKKNNPDKKTLCPVPMLGFEQLSKTHVHQHQMCDQQFARLEKIKENLKSINDKILERQQKLQNYRQDASNIARKLLRVICRQEIIRQNGVEGITKDEEVILANLEKINSDLRFNNKTVERINELKTHLKNKHTDVAGYNETSYENVLEEGAQNLIAKMLEENSTKISSIVQIVNSDISDMAAIKADIQSLNE